MERAMLWNNGAPVTISLTDKQHGKNIPVQGKQPDFSIVKGIPTDATLTVNEIPTNGIHASYLQATVACTIGSLNIERRYRIYADCPAIACDTYLKGQVELYQNKEDNRSNADRKNIEHTADMATGVKTPTLDRLQLSGNHWSARTIEFFDYTDWNDNLVTGRTWLPEGKKVDFIPVMGSGKKFAAKVGAQGRVSFELNDKNSFALYQYEVKP